MSPQAIQDYEEIFKEYIMRALVGEQLISFNQLLGNLINENPGEHKIIKYAYINVKKELTGFNGHNDTEEELCERFKHI